MYVFVWAAAKSRYTLETNEKHVSAMIKHIMGNTLHATVLCRQSHQFGPRQLRTKIPACMLIEVVVRVRVKFAIQSEATVFSRPKQQPSALLTWSPVYRYSSTNGLPCCLLFVPGPKPAYQSLQTTGSSATLQSASVRHRTISFIRRLREKMSRGR